MPDGEERGSQDKRKEIASQKGVNFFSALCQELGIVRRHGDCADAVYERLLDIGTHTKAARQGQVVRHTRGI